MVITTTGPHTTEPSQSSWDPLGTGTKTFVSVPIGFWTGQRYFYLALPYQRYERVATMLTSTLSSATISRKKPGASSSVRSGYAVAVTSISAWAPSNFCFIPIFEMKWMTGSQYAWNVF